MLSRVWMEGNKGEDGDASWAPNCTASSFNPLLDVETANWYAAAAVGGSGSGEQLLDSSASCSPTSAAAPPAFNNFGHEVNNYLVPQIPILIPKNPFDLGFENGYLGGGWNRDLGFLRGGGYSNDLVFQSLLGNNLNLSPQFAVQLGRGGFEELGFGEGPLMQPGNPNLLLNGPMILKPLDGDDNVTSTGSQPTLFRKRAVNRKNLENISATVPNFVNQFVRMDYDKSDKNGEIISERKRKASSCTDNVGGVNIEDSIPNYDDDESDDDDDDQVLMRNSYVNLKEGGIGNGESSSQANSTVTGDNADGKKKGHKAKNLMAERRRRKRLNDRLYMLRSVVPKISKMDRASILGDAVDYLKELTQRISELQTDLDSTPSSSSSQALTPMNSGLPARSIKEELSPRTVPSSLSSSAGQPASVEVRVGEGRAVNIHMFCGLRPGLLLSTMTAMDRLGLDIHQAVISCFNGFAMDVFQAEQCKEGQDLNADQIKALLLDSAGACNGTM